MFRRFMLMLMAVLISMGINASDIQVPDSGSVAEAAAVTAEVQIVVPVTSPDLPAGPVVLPPETMPPETTPPETTPPVKEETICISFAGDCTLGTDSSFSYKNSFPYRLQSKNGDFSYFFKGVKPVFEADDITLVNLETTLTNAAKPAIKRFRFKGDPSYVNILKEGSVEAVNIANNHIYDYLVQGFEETVDTLNKAEILYSGWDDIAYRTVKGVAIAFIGCTIWDNNLKEKVLENLKKAKDKAGIVVVSIHWGRERVYEPDESQTALGRFFIDNGADVVIGHHPHVIQGVECYKGRYIAYSLGNFCFGGNSNPSDKDSLIFQNRFTVRQGKLINVEAVIIPCSISSAAGINDYQPVLLDGNDKERVIHKVQKYSR